MTLQQSKLKRTMKRVGRGEYDKEYLPQSVMCFVRAFEFYFENGT